MIEITNLTVKTSEDKSILENITFNIKPHEIKCLTGASGSGKSTLLKTLMYLMDDNLKISSGKILINNVDIMSLSEKERRNLLGLEIGFIPQNPMTSFFAHKTMEEQMVSVLKIRKGLNTVSAKSKITEKINKLNIRDTDKILKSYPSELSGEILHRLAVDNIFALEPKIVLADEATSALDIKNKKILLDERIDRLGNHKSSKHRWIGDFISEMDNQCEEKWKWENLL